MMNDKVEQQSWSHSFLPCSSAPAATGEENGRHRSEQKNASTGELANAAASAKRKLPFAEAQNQEPPCKKNKTASKNKRGPGYSPYETRYLLNLLDEILPITPHEWEELRTRHSKAFFECSRTVRSLRRKFYTLQRAPVSSDPQSFPCRARSISALIKSRSEKRDGGEDGDNCSVVSTKVFDKHDDNRSEESGLSSEEEEGCYEEEYEYYESDFDSEEDDDYELVSLDQKLVRKRMFHQPADLYSSYSSSNVHHPKRLTLGFWPRCPDCFDTVRCNLIHV